MQQPVAPGDRRAQRLLVGGQVAGAAAERRQRPLKPRRQPLWREHAQPRRGKLERERQPVQAAADLYYGWSVLLGERKGRPCGLRLPKEQGDGSRCSTLSITSSRRRPCNAPISAESSGCPPASRTPTARAIAGTTL